MKFFLGLFLFVTLLVADFPKVYSQLGDEVYKNLPFIDNLKNLKEFARYKNEIEIYIFKAEEAKKHGFMIERGDKNANQAIYLEDLRKLIQTNKYFKDLVISSFIKSIDTNNNSLFVEIVNTYLLPPNYDIKILNYYNKNSDDIETSGHLATLVQKQLQQKEEQTRRIQKATQSSNTAKKSSNDSRIDRIREADAIRKEAYRKHLEEIEARKKAEIIAKQKRELAN